MLPELKVENAQTRDWYDSSAGQTLLAMTDDGRFVFLWEAILDDGGVIRQLEEFAFERALRDETFALTEAAKPLCRSSDILPKEKVQKFRLLRTAVTKKYAPWFTEDLEMSIDLAAGHQVRSFWCTDYSINRRRYIRRTVLGVSKPDQPDELLVISPSGATKVCPHTNQCFEGE